jgi:hypothetical protein
MNDKFRYGAVLFALALVVTTGCLGSVDADEVRENSLEAMETTETYEFEMDMNVTISGEGMPRELSVDMDGEGAVDETEQRMKMLSTVDMLGMGMDQDAYVVDDKMYTKMEMGETQGTEGMDEWYKIEDATMVSQMWNSSSYAEQYQELLEISEASYEQDTEVDGEEAYVISLEPEPEDYDELVQDRMAGMNMMDSMPGAEGSEMFGREDVQVNDFSATYWISKETDHVLRTRSNMTMEVPMGAMAPEGGDGMTINMVADVRLSNHGEEVDIELPDGAEDAEEFGSIFEGEAVSSSQSVGNTSTPDVGVDVPEDPEVDEEVDDLVEGVDVEVHEYEGAPDTHWAKVSFEDMEGEWLKVESVENGGSASTDSPGSTNYLGLSVAPEGDEILVTLGKEDGTVVQQRETYEP